MFESETNALPTKEQLLGVNVSLTSIVSALRHAFAQFELVDDADIVLAVGNTGCGKSTMLSSLVDGPDSLQLQTLREELAILEDPDQM